MPSSLVTVQPSEHTMVIQPFRGISAFLHVQINGAETEILVDTGAAVTVISSELFNGIPAEKRPELKPPYEELKLQTANNEHIAVQGVATIDMTVGQ